MQAMQAQWAARLRAIPDDFRAAIAGASDSALRHRPAPAEWSAIEVLGHMLDKMHAWCERVERIAAEDQPHLAGYDQDASVRDHAYQQSDAAALLDELAQRCERFAAAVEQVPDAALERTGVHAEFGPMTLRECVETPLEAAPDHLLQLKAALAKAHNM
jgi:uncharacterized damage-inducible protein DinB